MDKWKSKIWFLVCVVFAVCLTTIALKHFVTTPWHTLGELGGDGAKNNFTYLYHSLYGSGYWFMGMNYPYGEHIVYTDGQPLLSVLLTHIKGLSAGDVLKILWWLIDLSYVLSILFVYKILRHFRVGAPVAIIFAGLITIFSPQLFRIQGHYALAYTCIIPMIFYWLIQYNERPRLRYGVFLFIAGCLTAFLHLYYIAMMLIWVFGYAAGYFIFTRTSFLQRLKHVAPLLISVVAVFALVSIVMKFTDPVKDRPKAPCNSFYETCTRPRLIYTSANSPFWVYAQSKRWLYTLANREEGYMYLGLVLLFTLALSIAIIVVKSVRKKRLDIIISDTGFSPIWLFIALMALIVAMGIPFIWHEQWLDTISAFRQFRSLGRFSWIFYHIIAVYCVVVIYHYYLGLVAKRRFVLGFSLLLVSIGVWGYEAKGYIDYSRYRADYAMYNYSMLFSEEEQNWQSYLQDHHYSKDDFQAVLLLPFYHVGTEKLWLGNSEWIITLGTKAALQLHLPIIDVMMSRSSWSQAQKQVKLAGGPFTDKPILRDIKSNKPFLLLQFDEEKLDPDQKYLLSASDSVGRHAQCIVYVCYPDRIAANDKKNADSINTILPHMHAADTCFGDNSSWFADHFDASVAGEKLFGAGAHPYMKTDSTVIDEIPVRATDGQLFEFSCWFLLGNEDYQSPDLVLTSLDSAGKVVDVNHVNTNKSTDSYGMWFRASKYFHLGSNARKVRCSLINRPGPSYKIMDELLLRPAAATVISKAADGTVLVNNHRFKIVTK